jgi:ABC-type transport system involved in multi-copper enzyme maturation permease subunit
VSGVQVGNGRPVASAGSPSPTWRVVFSRELRDLWIGGKALYLILIYSVMLGIYSYLLASNAEVNLLPLHEMVLEIVKSSIAAGLFLCLLIGADSVSGERERATLEGLLLTPTSRRQVVVGKFLAAMSPWPVALAITIPYWKVLSRGDEIFGPAVVWGVVLGTLLVPALAGLGILVSIACNSNKTSMLVSIGFYLLLLLPTELSRPGRVETVAEARRAVVSQWINPWDAASKFLGKTLINGLPLSEIWFLLILPVALSVVVVALLFVFGGRNLRLEAETARTLRSYWDRWRRVVSVLAPQPDVSQHPGASQGGRPHGALADAPRGSGGRRPAARRMEPSGSAPPTWWVVFRKELRDLWLGGKALNLILAYTVVVAVYSYMMAQDSTLSLIPPKEMVFELLKVVMVVAVFIGLIIGADSLSGERERATLEGLLLTPASRRQIVVGKFLAAVSPWPVALIITVPYLRCSGRDCSGLRSSGAH